MTLCVHAFHELSLHSGRMYPRYSSVGVRCQYTAQYSVVMYASRLVRFRPRLLVVRVWTLLTRTDATAGLPHAPCRR